jgi:TATA-box binding protein (TBP) (component of TFIID and TFIIIB)
MCLLRDTLESAISPPALYYIDRPKLTMLISQNGNTIIAGAKSEEEEGLEL